MNNVRIIFGVAASLGVAVVVACSSCSSNSSSGDSQDSGPSGSGSGSGSASGDATVDGDGATGVTCVAPQIECVGVLGDQTCVDPGASCLGTSVTTKECSATRLCPGGQVCCSGYVTVDGGAIYLPDGSAFADGGGFGGLSGLTGAALAVQCLSACPVGAVASQVCSLDGKGPSCPTGTVCRNLYPAAFAPAGLPNTLCLAPVPEGGAGFPRRDASTEDSGSSNGGDAATSLGPDGATE